MSDIISRADAIRWVKTECNPYGKPTLDYDSGLKVIEHLKKMPSELPSAELPKGELISRADAIDAVRKCVVESELLADWDKAMESAQELLSELPSAEAVSKGVLEQFRWERDVAMGQLEEYGIPFGTNKDEDMVRVVRCKDCKDSRVYGKTTQWLACESVMEGQATDPDGYCYLGKRREESEVEK